MRSALSRNIHPGTADVEGGVIGSVAALQEALEDETRRRLRAEAALKKSEEACRVLSRRMALCAKYVEDIVDFQDFFKAISEQ